MAVKSSCRTFHKEKGTKGNYNTVQDHLPDEIALRNEILELKRQLMILKRTNEKNLVKLRKYEDEAKRKDREIEQLMDPRKNAEITKNLSTKGAAILMNLKDQNNSLIQMVLNKDLQIRRLIAEIKTSKLYVASKKAEPYKAEILRLRNLLIKSQEMLRENLSHQTKSTESIIGNPYLEIPSSSDQSTPRELEELRSSIQSLETYIQYSNELLAKKNQEILTLTHDLNTLQKFSHCKNCKKYSLKQDSPTFFHKQEPSVDDSTFQLRDSKKMNFTASQPTLSSEELLGLFEKTMKITNYKNVPNSAPTGSYTKSSSNETSPNHESNIAANNSVDVWEEGMKKDESENISKKLENCNETDVTEKNKIEDSTNGVQKLHINDSSSRELFKEKKKRVKGGSCKVKEKYRNAISKYKNFKAQNSWKSSKNLQNHKTGKNIQEEILSSISDAETREFEILEKEIMNEEIKLEKESQLTNNLENSEEMSDHIPIEMRPDNDKECASGELSETFREKHEEDNSISSLKTETGEVSPKQITDCKRSPSPNNDDSIYLFSFKTDLNQERNEAENTHIKDFAVSNVANNTDAKLGLILADQIVQSEYLERTENETESFEQPKVDVQPTEDENQKTASTSSPEIQKELQNLKENTHKVNVMEIKNLKSTAKLCQNNFDSSFESEYSYSTKHESQVVQVEVQINSAPTQSDNSQSEDGTSRSSKSEECQLDECYFAYEDESNDDDDDVVIR